MTLFVCFMTKNGQVPVVIYLLWLKLGKINI